MRNKYYIAEARIRAETRPSLCLRCDTVQMIERPCRVCKACRNKPPNTPTPSYREIQRYQPDGPPTGKKHLKLGKGWSRAF